MSEKDTIQALIDMKNTDSAMLAVIETLGRRIDELTKELNIKTIRVEVLERELKKVKGGNNEW